MNTDLRLAMLGMVPGNGHPYSWSAIFNGYDAEAMARGSYPVIARYLGQQPASEMGNLGARVTHIWTDDPNDAAAVAPAALIPNIVQKPEEVIGEVDAVLISADFGYEHVERCRSFVEAGLPIFVDKPMCDNEADLQTFVAWVKGGARILSSSGLRYTKEFAPYRMSTKELGELRFVTATAHKSWERYGIHALEGLYPIVGPGFVSARNGGTAERSIVHLKHNRGIDVVIAVIEDMAGSFGTLQLCGTAAAVNLTQRDTFWSFRAQLQAFIEFIRTGARPFPFDETIELMKIIIAGTRSREEGGREVMLSEISEESISPD